MRVLHVFTWFAPGNPFGGPATVALNQAAELRARGHTVDVIAATPFRPAPRSWRAPAAGVRGFRGTQVLRGAGFAGIASPGILWFAARAVRRYDVVHVHLARDLVTLPIAWLAQRLGVPVVAQPHGMIDRSHRRSARVLDTLATRRVLGGARRVFALTTSEASDLQAIGQVDSARIELLGNGVLQFDDSDSSQSTRDEVEVIFCARLHERKRPVAFATMARTLLAAGSAARFTLIGADEGELVAVQAIVDAVGDDRFSWQGVLDPSAVPARLARAALLVHPAVDEPFGMVIAEALSTGRPVVLTDLCDLASFVREHRCGLVVPADDHAALAEAVRTLVDDPVMRHDMGRRGRKAAREHFGMPAVIDSIEHVYRLSAHHAGGRGPLRRSSHG